MGCGGDGEIGVVEGSDGGSGGGGGRGRGFPLGMPVRVLLVEGDNSTRKIIAALLTKCEYRERASDGLEAWNILKEKADNIDLILTETELPSISGFVLLNMIKENESCQHIPVITMSSHDSISMVFKCLLKGAADFLVKPIRKNELRNLWQHVWRRQYAKGSRGVIDAHQAEHLAEQKHDTIEKNASNYSNDKVICMKQSEQNSKKDSDAQSSCTRSEMEVESIYMQNIEEIAHKRVVGVSLIDNNAECKASCNAEIVVHDDTEDNSTMFDSQVRPCGNVCGSIIVTKEEGKPELVAAGTNDQTAHHRTSTQAIDLIGSIDNHHLNHEIRNGEVPWDGFSYPAQSSVHCVNSVPRSSPHLELSLRRYHHPSFYQKGKDENGALNHSNYSAFSLYNSKTALPISGTQRNLSTEDNNSLIADTQDKDSCMITSFSHENDSASHGNQEHGILATSQTLPQNGAAIAPPAPVIPIPVPVIWQPTSQVMQPIFYPSQALWNTVPSVWQETVQGSSSNHNVPGGSTDQHVTKKLQTSEDLPQNVLKTMELGKQQGHVSSSRSQLDCDGVPGGIYVEKNIDPSICKSHVENASDGGVPAEEELQYNMIDQREAALAKFRLKRKDRCYEKKVRYESRKRLAEQRPRVKGQFVRQVQQIGSTNG